MIKRHLNGLMINIFELREESEAFEVAARDWLTMSLNCERYRRPRLIDCRRA